MSVTPSDRLRAKQPRRITVGVFLDDNLADRLDAAVMALHDARRTQAPADDVAALEAAKDTAQAVLDDETMWFTFQAIGRNALARLTDAHPPTDEQVEEAAAEERGRPDYDPATFAPALLAAACIAPALTVEDFEGVYASEAWNDDERGALFAAALSVCTRARPLQVRTDP